MSILKNRSIRALVLIMSALALIGFLIANLYYKNSNSSVDPRIVPARQLYKEYNYYAQQNDFDSVLYLMDTIETIYHQHKHYRNSFEVGVLYNNRAASYLTMALSSNDRIYKDSCLHLAEQHVKQCIKIYNSWKEIYAPLDGDSIIVFLKTSFFPNSAIYSKNEKERFLLNRVDEITDALNDIDRRLSVSYTNLGMVYRHKEQYDDAASNYVKAMKLWDRNLTAENNLNILLGKPLKKRNIIQMLFPPKKD